MDALTALTQARSWSSALGLLREARPDDPPAEVAASLRAAATAVMCWDEVALLLDASYSLQRIQGAQEDTERARRLALALAQRSARPLLTETASALSDGPDIPSVRLTALSRLDDSYTRQILAESRLRDEIERRTDRLIRRIDFIAGTRDLLTIEREIADRLARLGDLERYRELSISIERRAALASSPREIVLSAASELSEAQARAHRAASLRQLATTPAEVLAADAAAAAAHAEVRAIQQRDQGGTSDALAAAESAAEALFEAGRLPS